MTATAEPPIVDPSSAPYARRPHLLGVEYLALDYFGIQRYRCEGWQLTNGDTVVIVTDNGGTSLMNASEKIAAMLRERWEVNVLTIIEDWIEPYFPGEPLTRFRVSDEHGGNTSVDYDKLEACGLVLPR